MKTIRFICLAILFYTKRHPYTVAGTAAACAVCCLRGSFGLIPAVLAVALIIKLFWHLAKRVISRPVFNQWITEGGKLTIPSKKEISDIQRKRNEKKRRQTMEEFEKHLKDYGF